MDFTPARPDAVRAINQRWLLKFWARHLDGARVPCWQTVKTDDLASLADNLSFLDVTRSTPPRFMIRFHGRMIGKVYGSSDCRARYLDEVIPAARQDEALAAYTKAVENGAPVYTILDLNDPAGRVIHFERLLLPFSRDGQFIDRILAAFEFVSPDGDFNAQALLCATGAPPVARLSATIEVPAMA